MPASTRLKALGLTTALGIAAVSFIYETVPPQDDPYSAAIKLIAGMSMATGSLLLSSSVSGTFLRNGGRGAFKALYWASLASLGVGISEAASGLMPMDVPVALLCTALAFTGAGMHLLRFHSGGLKRA